VILKLRIFFGILTNQELLARQVVGCIFADLYKTLK